MSIASELLKLLGESGNPKKERAESNEILLSADNKETLVEVLREIKASSKIARIVEGAQYFTDPPYNYRKDTPHSPTGLTHWHCFKKNKQIGVVNINGTGHDGSSGIRLPNRPADFVRSKGVNLSITNKIAGNLNEDFFLDYVVIISEIELLSLLLWNRD
jgi:hypothetical protein